MVSSPENVVKFYSNRGTMENFIKEGKNGFTFDKMSSSNFIVNANKLQQVVLAYNLINWFNRLSFPYKDLFAQVVDKINVLSFST